MASIVIKGKSVTVDDEFLNLPRDQQDAVVDDIAADMEARGEFTAGDPKKAMSDKIAAKMPELRANQAPYVEGAIKGLEAGGGISPEEEASGEWERGVILPIAKNTATGERKAAVPGVVMGAYDAFKLPGDVASGKVDPMSDEGIARGVGFTTVFSPGAPKGGKIPAGNTLAVVPKDTAKAAIPTAADLKVVAQTAYDAAKGSEIAATATPGLIDSLMGVLTKEGLVRPDGKLASTFGAVRTAMKDATAYKGKPMTFEQFQRLEEALQGVAGSKSPGEGRIGKMLLDEMDKYFAGLPDDAFSKGSADAVKKGYAGGKAGWAQYSKLSRIEKAVDKAGRAKAGFTEGLRSQFRAILDSESKSRGFTKDELAMMDKFVKGGTLEGITGWLGGLRNTVLGTMAGGPVIGGAMALSGGASNILGKGSAKKTANQLRASIASGAGNTLKGSSEMPPKSALTGLGKLATGGATRASGPYADDVGERGGFLESVLPSLRVGIAGT
jgi:hypothetical protein